MNRRTLLTAFLPGIIGSALPVFAQSGKLCDFRVRLKSKSVVSTTIVARDQYEAVVKITKRCPGCTILNLKPV
jgi:hypothetical protein